MASSCPARFLRFPRPPWLAAVAMPRLARPAWSSRRALARHAFASRAALTSPLPAGEDKHRLHPFRCGCGLHASTSPAQARDGIGSSAPPTPAPQARLASRADACPFAKPCAFGAASPTVFPGAAATPDPPASLLRAPAGCTGSSVHGSLECGPALPTVKMFHRLSLLNVRKQASASASAAASRGRTASSGERRPFRRRRKSSSSSSCPSLPAVGSKQEMDAASTSKRGRRPPNKPQKLKFKPKVPSRKPKKPTAQKPQPEETKPIDEEVMKTLRTGRGDAKTSRAMKDEQSAQNSKPTLSPAAGISFQAAQSGKQKQPTNSQKALQIPKAYPANPERFYRDEDDDDDDEDDNNAVRGDDNDAELQQTLQEHDDKTRMFLFQLPKSLPLLRTPSIVVHRNGKAIVKEVKEGYNLNDLPGGYMGKMLVYKSGKVKMKLGDAMFDVSPGTESGMLQHAVVMNTRRKHCCQLGEIEKQHVVVTPDVDSLLSDNRG
ncbi:hypothetical protein ZWY2020_059520 [Hordeum vulgare]|nr:hypothetical protein ZWY2020_059520 [Hordeum vulgare]